MAKKSKKKGNLMRFFGKWSEDAEEWKKIEKEIYEDRKKFKTRDISFE